MSDHLRVALLIESSRGYGRTVLRGIVAYGRTHGLWAFFHEERDLASPLPKNLKRWRPDASYAAQPALRGVVAAAPKPGTVALLAAALVAGFAAWRRRRN